MQLTVRKGGWCVTDRTPAECAEWCLRTTVRAAWRRRSKHEARLYVCRRCGLWVAASYGSRRCLGSLQPWSQQASRSMACSAPSCVRRLSSRAHCWCGLAPTTRCRAQVVTLLDELSNLYDSPAALRTQPQPLGKAEAATRNPSLPLTRLTSLGAWFLSQLP